MFMMMCFSFYENLEIRFKMPECRTVRHPVSPVPERKKLTVPEPVRYRTKLMQSRIFLFWYRTEIMDAGIPMPALVSSMPTPSFAIFITIKASSRLIGGFLKPTASALD
jgi:hypothetical protein